MLTANESLEQLYFGKSEYSWDMQTPGTNLKAHSGDDLRHNA